MFQNPLIQEWKLVMYTINIFLTYNNFKEDFGLGKYLIHLASPL